MTRLRLLLLIPAIFLIPALLRADGNPDFDVQAHRGGRALRPENTLAAFTRAVDLGVDTLELDLAVTADRVVVVSHDYRLNPLLTRGPDGKFLAKEETVLIRDLDFEELQRYTVGEIKPRSDYWYRFRDQLPVPEEQIPSLAQVFQLVDSMGAVQMRYNLEIKTYPPLPEYTIDYREFVDLVVETIREHRLEPRVTIQSFDWRTLQAVKERAPEIPLVCLTVGSFSISGAWYNLQPGRDGSSPWLAGLDADDYSGAAELVQAFGAGIWSPYYREIGQEDVEAAHRLGLRIIPWTVNDRRIMKKLLGWGVDGIITDVPDLLIRVLEETATDQEARRPAAGSG